MAPPSHQWRRRPVHRRALVVAPTSLRHQPIVVAGVFPASPPSMQVITSPHTYSGNCQPYRSQLVLLSAGATRAEAYMTQPATSQACGVATRQLNGPVADGRALACTGYTCTGGRRWMSAKCTQGPSAANCLLDAQLATRLTGDVAVPALTRFANGGQSPPAQRNVQNFGRNQIGSAGARSNRCQIRPASGRVLPLAKNEHVPPDTDTLGARAGVRTSAWLLSTSAPRAVHTCHLPRRLATIGQSGRRHLRSPYRSVATPNYLSLECGKAVPCKTGWKPNVASGSQQRIQHYLSRCSAGAGGQGRLGWTPADPLIGQQPRLRRVVRKLEANTNHCRARSVTAGNGLDKCSAKLAHRAATEQPPRSAQNRQPEYRSGPFQLQASGTPKSPATQWMVITIDRGAEAHPAAHAVKLPAVMRYRNRKAYAPAVSHHCLPTLARDRPGSLNDR